MTVYTGLTYTSNPQQMEELIDNAVDELTRMADATSDQPQPRSDLLGYSGDYLGQIMPTLIVIKYTKIEKPCDGKYVYDVTTLPEPLCYDDDGSDLYTTYITISTCANGACIYSTEISMEETPADILASKLEKIIEDVEHAYQSHVVNSSHASVFNIVSRTIEERGIGTIPSEVSPIVTPTMNPRFNRITLPYINIDGRTLRLTTYAVPHTFTVTIEEGEKKEVYPILPVCDRTDFTNKDVAEMVISTLTSYLSK